MGCSRGCSGCCGCRGCGRSCRCRSRGMPLTANPSRLVTLAVVDSCCDGRAACAQVAHESGSRVSVFTVMWCIHEPKCARDIVAHLWTCDLDVAIQTTVHSQLTQRTLCLAGGCRACGCSAGCSGGCCGCRGCRGCGRSCRSCRGCGRSCRSCRGGSCGR